MTFCQEKIPYATKRDAKRALKQAQSRRGRTQHVGSYEKTIYQCPICSLFHLSHQRPRKKAA